MLGYGADWPLDWRDMWDWYCSRGAGAVDFWTDYLSLGSEAPALSHCGHIRSTGGAAPRPRRGGHGVCVDGDAARDPIRTQGRQSPPCVYRGFCRFGCSTNAKQSQLVTFIPRALAAGAEIRDLAMVGRIEMDANGRATGVHYHRDGRWRFQKARAVVVAGYAIETPRLLLNSATTAFRTVWPTAAASSARIS